MAFGKNALAKLYKKRARHYDLSANLYYLVGFRELAFRRKAVRALRLKPGETVVEIGCGTGLNFALLREKIGPEGRIIGVDLTPEMLAEAQKRIRRNGWANVFLVRSDAVAYTFPERTNGIISTFAITLMPEYDRIIQKGAEALSSGSRFVVLDFKKSDKWPMWLIKLFVFITKPYGVSLDQADRHPWESIEKHLTPVHFEELYFGGAYISVGEAP